LSELNIDCIGIRRGWIISGNAGEFTGIIEIEESLFNNPLCKFTHHKPILADVRNRKMLNKSS
jgi:hypothetical protein